MYYIGKDARPGFGLQIILRYGVKRMNYNQIVAERITALCEENEMSIAELASLCKMNRATIEHILDGKCKKPRIQTIYKISAAFHMTVREFLDCPEEMDASEVLVSPDVPDSQESAC